MEQKLRYKPPRSNLKLGLICLSVSAALILLVVFLPLNGFTFYMAIFGGLLGLGGLGILLAQLDYTHPRYVVLDLFEIHIPQGIKNSHPVKLPLKYIHRFRINTYGNIKLYYSEEEEEDEDNIMVKILGKKEIKFQEYTIEKDWLSPQDFELVKRYLEDRIIN